MTLPIVSYNAEVQKIYNAILSNAQSKYSSLHREIEKCEYLFNPDFLCRLTLQSRRFYKDRCIDLRYCIVIRLTHREIVNCRISVWPELFQYQNNLYPQKKSITGTKNINRLNSEAMTTSLKVVHQWILNALGIELIPCNQFWSDLVLFSENGSARQSITSDRTCSYEEFQSSAQLEKSFLYRNEVFRQDGRPALCKLSGGKFFKSVPLVCIENSVQESKEEDLSELTMDQSLIFRVLFQ